MQAAQESVPQQSAQEHEHEVADGARGGKLQDEGQLSESVQRRSRLQPSRLTKLPPQDSPGRVAVWGEHNP